MRIQFPNAFTQSKAIKKSPPRSAILYDNVVKMFLLGIEIIFDNEIPNHYAFKRFTAKLT